MALLPLLTASFSYCRRLHHQRRTPDDGSKGSSRCVMALNTHSLRDGDDEQVDAHDVDDERTENDIAQRYYATQQYLKYLAVCNPTTSTNESPSSALSAHTNNVGESSSTHSIGSTSGGSTSTACSRLSTAYSDAVYRQSVDDDEPCSRSSSNTTQYQAQTVTATNSSANALEESLPEALLYVLLIQLPQRDIIRCRSVSKRWKEVCDTVPLGERVLTVCTDGMIQLWDVKAKELMHTVSATAGTPSLEMTPLWVSYPHLNRKHNLTISRSDWIR